MEIKRDRCVPQYLKINEQDGIFIREELSKRRCVQTGGRPETQNSDSMESQDDSLKTKNLFCRKQS